MHNQFRLATALVLLIIALSVTCTSEAQPGIQTPGVRRQTLNPRLSDGKKIIAKLREKLGTNSDTTIEIKSSDELSGDITVSGRVIEIPEDKDSLYVDPNPCHIEEKHLIRFHQPCFKEKLSQPYDCGKPPFEKWQVRQLK